MVDYSTQHISQTLIDEIVYALRAVHQYGSIEIYVQNSTVTQITVRNIKKTSVSIGHTPQEAKKMKPSEAIISHVHT